MNDAIVHRGPDSSGFYISGNIGLAMRRLSIIDLAGGEQPVSNESNTVFLVYNGEIYNHLDLREEMEGKGHHYRSHSDTESIVHLYEQYGRDCVHHLRGMFAFALWDTQKQTLFAARDRLGIKPFYYYCSSDLFLFGSEIKAILAYPGIHPRLNRGVLSEYLAFGYLSGIETMFDDIFKLQPGHTLEIDRAGNIDIRQYWDLDSHENGPDRPAKYYSDTYRELLDQAVESHLMSDVPLGVFLSGGIDSSTIAGLMTKKQSDQILTFSVGYDEQAYSELGFAREFANQIRSRHFEVKVSQKEFWAAMPKLIWHEDEPLVWPSSVSLYFVARLAQEHVKVVLTGEGSDETLAGYARYPLTLWNSRADNLYRHMIPSSVRSRLRRALSDSDLLSADLRRTLAHTFLGRDGNTWSSFYLDNFYSAFSSAEQKPLLNEDILALGSNPYASVLSFWNKSEGDLLKRMLYTDIKTYLVELLMKQDNMSMAASVESRVPFLDHVLVEFAASIPSKLKTKGLREGKSILKEAVRDIVPDSILFRRKMGFPTPWKKWLAGAGGDDVEQILLDPRSLERNLFRPEALRLIIAEHRSGKRDHTDRLWRLFNLELWQRLFLDGEGPTTESYSPEMIQKRA